MSEKPDIGEAVDYILAERPALDEDDVWNVLMELQDPPAPGTDRVALNLIAQVRPAIRRRDVKLIIKEWRAYAGLATAGDWDDEE